MREQNGTLFFFLSPANDYISIREAHTMAVTWVATKDVPTKERISRIDGERMWLHHYHRQEQVLLGSCKMILALRKLPRVRMPPAEDAWTKRQGARASPGSRSLTPQC
jgi:hypothetical protein